MKLYKKYQSKYGIYKAIIEEDFPDVGFYLYIWKNGIGLNDYLQDSLAICKEQAFEEFGIPLDCWVEITE